MFSEVTESIAKLLTQRHENRKIIFGDKPYANYGYWTRPDQTIEEACNALTDQVALAAGLGRGDRVLEVGCGGGASAVYYTQRYHPASVIGLDVTEVRIQDAQEYIAANGLADTIQVRLGDATALDFPAEAFIRVLAIECALHFNTRRDFLREAARVLAPGGTLAMTDIIPRRGVDRAQYLARVHFPANSDGSLDVPENVYDADTYAAYLREAGFTDVRVEAITDRTMRPFADYLEGVARRTEGPRGLTGLHIVQLYRDYLELGVEVVLVAARKAE
jgi:microcystin synthetase protein McyJ